MPLDQEALVDESSSSKRIEFIGYNWIIFPKSEDRLDVQNSLEKPSLIEHIPSAMVSDVTTLHEEEFERDEKFVVVPSEKEMEVSVLETLPSPLPFSPPLIQQTSPFPKILEEPSRKPNISFMLPPIHTPLRVPIYTPPHPLTFS